VRNSAAGLLEWLGWREVPLERVCAADGCFRPNRRRFEAVLRDDDRTITYRFCSARHMRGWHDRYFWFAG